MGTRHLIAVISDGDFKIAQYGQWDGYPSGQGEDVVKFIREGDLDGLRANVTKLRWAEDADHERIKTEVGLDDSGWMNMEQAERYKQLYPALTRDCGSDILGLVAAGGIDFLVDQSSFALDSLFCEWAYVVDLDANQLEVYRGFQTEPHDKGRWAGQFKAEKHRDAQQYYPVALVGNWSFETLQALEDVGDWVDTVTALTSDGDDED